jgi:hypothetical protein
MAIARTLPLPRTAGSTLAIVQRKTMAATLGRYPTYWLDGPDTMTLTGVSR